MSEPRSMLVTSERMQDGALPLLFTGGACNVQDASGSRRNPGRDELARWLDGQGWPYFDPQIHPSTHGREYDREVDAPQEKIARRKAELRVYEILPATLGAAAMLEVMDDARRGLRSIVWFHGGRDFRPIGVGELIADDPSRRTIGGVAYRHLVAYVEAGRRLREELPDLLADSREIVFVDRFDELKDAIQRSLAR